MSIREGLSVKQEAFLGALLVEPTVNKAAALARISEATATRYRSDPTFTAAYQQARQRQLDEAIARLTAQCGAAVECLVRNLDCGEAAVEVRAAGVILRQALGLKTEISGPGGGQIPITEIIVELREPAAGMSLRPPQREPWTSSPPLPEPVSVENTERLNPDGGLTVVLDMPSWQISSDE